MRVAARLARAATELVKRHSSQQIRIVHAALRDLDDLFGHEARSRILDAFYKSQFVTRITERQRHLVDRSGVKCTSCKKASDWHDTVLTGRSAKTHRIDGKIKASFVV